MDPLKESFFMDSDDAEKYNPREKLVGKRVRMLHIPSGEVHAGEVVDYGDDNIIVMMEETAELFISDDDLVIDTKVDKWKLIDVIDA